ncbi:translation initiation factor IF-2, partial [Candidatus Roizmanbacteria bacterium CG_4_10_14_3_um_filter_33_21]
MIARSPIVAILGHVDHGKTTLLDYLRKSQIAAKEFGGITQKIGGYSVNTGIKDYQTETITFIDTPGHEAFSKLRARGATVADIAILVIDGKDSIMPQTVESIAHIKAANIPFIVTITKSDLPDSNPEKVKRDLLKHDVLTENKGGKVPVVSVSAKTGSGINELLETILLIATDLNLTYDPKNSLQAHIIENKKDRRGIVASVIVKDGTLKVGDDVY